MSSPFQLRAVFFPWCISRLARGSTFLNFSISTLNGDLVVGVIMSTVKSSSRSRGTAASVKENGVKLEEGLNPFKSDRFDAEVYVQSNCSLNDKVQLSILSPFYRFTLAFHAKRLTVWFCLTQFSLIHAFFCFDFRLRNSIFISTPRFIVLLMDDCFRTKFIAEWKEIN